MAQITLHLHVGENVVVDQDQFIRALQNNDLFISLTDPADPAATPMDSGVFINNIAYWELVP